MRHRTDREDLKLHCHWNFESVEDMVDYCNDPNTPDRGGKSSHAAGAGSGTKLEDVYANWHGSADFKQATGLLKRGWPEGANAINDMMKDMSQLGPVSELIGEAEVETYDVSGAYVDVGAFLEGDPECLIDWDTTEDTSPRVISIYVNLCTSSGTNARKMVRRGVATAALVDCLETRGIRCEVVVVSANGWRPRKAKQVMQDDDEDSWNAIGSIIRVVVKRAHQPLDMDRLSFCLAHPSMFRRFMFRVMESEPDVPGGYGSVRTLRTQDLRRPGIVVATDDSNNDGVWDSNDSARDWVMDQLAYCIPSLHEDLVKQGKRKANAKQMQMTHGINPGETDA